ncbi:MAG TPA: hypothetical protein PLD73_17500 [Candidatus Hydrogenedentes bacterium]|nr:hypothetical protein [Candidatus Hydrogenedentota bacterium]HPJ98004.1 hypothetical protein [Candidatus Hydrogenedentota bacterium]
MRHIRTVTRARVCEAQAGMEVLRFIGALFSIFTALSRLFPAFAGMK